MNRIALRMAIALVGLGVRAGTGQEALAAPVAASSPAKAAAPAAPAAVTRGQANQEVRPAIKWKQFDYTCEGGAKLTVYLLEQTAKVLYQDHRYFLKQTRSAEGGRYSDGRIVWWGRGNGGFLQEDTPDGDGKMIVKDCQLNKPLPRETVTGTVSYLQRMALPPDAVIQVQLQDVSLGESRAKVIAEQDITLGGRQVPVPFELKFAPANVEANHRYTVGAKIFVGGELRFIHDKAYPVLIEGSPSHVEMILKQVAPREKARP